jgi:UDP-N-acetyl-D-mannosaminuronic acid dehydrogenase
MKCESICVIGLGYIGLPTATVLANAGRQVHGVDISDEVLKSLSRGRAHIVEPGLDIALQEAVSSGRFTVDSVPRESDVFIICVPTPFYETGGVPEPNIDLVLAAARSLSPYLRNGNLVILESTSPVGTTARVKATLATVGLETSGILFAYCPERVLPGRAMHELVHNDRVVGGLDDISTRAAAEFYRYFVRGKVFETDAATAEMCKLTENSFRDVNIAFANELSVICAREGIDVWKLIELANRHPRVSILQPGVGVGGHCIAVDPWFIVARHPDHAKLIQSARVVNSEKTEWVISDILYRIELARKVLGREPLVACLGLAFKPDIDDLRESPAVSVVRALINKGNPILVVEPYVQESEEFSLVPLEEAVQRADILVVLVRHRQFLNGTLSSRSMIGKVADYCGAVE